MKTYLKLIPLIYLLSSSFVLSRKPSPARWVINSACTLKVAGSTNVNKFACTIINYANPDTLSFCNSTSAGPVKVSGTVALDVQNFDCQNAMMTRDLRKTLKAEQFPKLIIRFISLSKYPDLGGQPESVQGMVDISLAGITRRYDVDYQVISKNGKSLILIGNQQVHFSDFELTPPRKMGGIIKTNNVLGVEFNLKLKVL